MAGIQFARFRFLSYVNDLDQNGQAAFALKDSSAQDSPAQVYPGTFINNGKFAEIAKYLTDQTKNTVVGTKLGGKNGLNPTFSVEITGVENADDSTGAITINYKPKVTINGQTYVGTRTKSFTFPAGFLTYQQDVDQTTFE